MSTVLFLINVVARLAVILVGLLVLLGEMSLFPPDTTLNETFCVIVILFGLYRLIQYAMLRRQDSDSPV